MRCTFRVIVRSSAGVYHFEDTIVELVRLARFFALVVDRVRVRARARARVVRVRVVYRAVCESVNEPVNTKRNPKLQCAASKYLS